MVRSLPQWLPALGIVAIVLFLRLPFLNQAIQGDDVYYLAAAEHAQIDPLHPNHARYLFLGELVDMRGHPHPPLNAWILAGLLAALGDVYEVPYHLFYVVFSIAAALGMWSLAQRFCRCPFLATLLFLAVPAFVVNGNTLEADLPFLAFWMAAIALFVRAVDRKSGIDLVLSAIAAALAALAAYQAIFLVPILAVYLLERRSKWTVVWAVVLAAPIALGVWQLYERASSGALPASVLAGYMGTHGWQALAQKIRSAAALTVHLGWIVSPIIVLAGFTRGARWQWLAAGIAAAAGAFYDPNPMFWLSLGCGVLVAAWSIRQGFLGAWILIFFAAAVAVFFAGSSRYLLPLAAPVAILAARSVSARILRIGLALQIVISLALATVNYQHVDGYRQFAASISKEIPQHRTWINGEWGLRYYLESAGALPLAIGQPLQADQIVASSALALPLPVNAGLAPLAESEIRPWIPLRLISLDGLSAYSVASRGLRPFDFSTGPIDILRANLVVERKVELSWIDPRDPHAAAQIVDGLFPDGWMAERASVILKRPEHPVPLRVTFYIPPQAPARHIQLLIDGKLMAEETFPVSGSYSLTIPPTGASPTVTATLIVDKTFSSPPDQRRLGVIVSQIGFLP